MPTYSGSFPLAAQGHAVTVKLDGVALTDPAPGNVGSAVRNGQLTYAYTYSAGDDDTTLEATVQTSAGLVTAYLELDSTASIEAGGVGASETAFFVATLTGDTSGTPAQATLTANPDYGDLPTWVSIVDGAAVLGSDAGGCVAALAAQTDFDFSATTAPDDPGTVHADYNVQRNGSGFATGSSLNSGVTATGTGADLVSLDPVDPDGGLIFGGAVTVLGNATATDAASDPVTDGVATHHFALTITRVAQAPGL